MSGSWYDAITVPTGSNSARGLNTINSDLTDLEQKRLLFCVQNLNIVDIATGSNFALLSVSLGTAPSNFAVVGHPILPISNATGSLVALLSGTEGVYQSKVEVLIDNKYFAPVQFNCEFKKTVSVVAEAVSIPKIEKKQDIKVSAAPIILEKKQAQPIIVSEQKNVKNDQELLDEDSILAAAQSFLNKRSK